MRDILAERLLAEVMHWTAEDVAHERPDLQMLAAIKYDYYQRFSPGMRFIESLSLWLNQFETDDERRRAYDFIRAHLIFISDTEMKHLVSITFPDYIRPLLIKQTAHILGISDKFVYRITNSAEYKIILRQSLFLGLSDGAQVDYFRRTNPQITHEQVRQTYEITEERAQEMRAELGADLARLTQQGTDHTGERFRTVFLLDDFSGSGLSYIRREPDGTYGGKISKVFRDIYSNKLANLVSPNDLQICIVLYLATIQARQHLKQLTSDWLSDNSIDSTCPILVIQEIPHSVRVDNIDASPISDLLEKYFDESILDRHYKKGQHSQPYLGYDHCALPLILSHNTPNNTVPLLWYGEGFVYRGLCRVGRGHY